MTREKKKNLVDCAAAIYNNCHLNFSLSLMCSSDEVNEVCIFCLGGISPFGKYFACARTGEENASKNYVLVSVDHSRLLQSQCHVGNVSASCGGYSGEA